MPELHTVLGDITRQNVDAIVNAANRTMRGGGGVDGAIHRRGGPAILQDCIERFPRGLATGDAGWTTAGDLPARWVIHTVGPNYAEGERDKSLLESCYQRSLEIAEELGAKTVAFPLISAGTFGWPLPEAIITAIRTIAATQVDIQTCFLVAHESSAHDQINAIFELFRPPPEPLSKGMTTERLRLRHDWDPAPFTDCGRFIVRERTDGEAGVAIILADNDIDYRAYHLGPSEIDAVVRAMTLGTEMHRR